MVPSAMSETNFSASSSENSHAAGPLGLRGPDDFVDALLVEQPAAGVTELIDACGVHGLPVPRRPELLEPDEVGERALLLLGEPWIAGPELFQHRRRCILELLVPVVVGTFDVAPTERRTMARDEPEEAWNPADEPDFLRIPARYQDVFAWMVGDWGRLSGDVVPGSGYIEVQELRRKLRMGN